MPNYILTANSVFQPFTYQELALPIDRQDAYFEKLNEEYDKMSSQADVLEAMGKNDRDRNSKTYAQYKAYSDALRSEADNLYANGLDTESRQRLTDLRRKYNQEIVPIQNAWQKREQEADMQMKASLQNPSLMFTRDARNSTLDEYIANPTGGYGIINGANITAQMSSMAKNLEKQVRSGRRENIDDFTYNYIKEYGLTPDMIRDWRNSPTLTRMFEQVMQANGVTPDALNGSANARRIINQSTGYAEMGMWSAIGADQSQIQDNFKARADYNFALQEQHANNEAVRKAAVEAAKNGSAGGDDVTVLSTGVGLKTSDAYTADGLKELNKLKGGTDGLRASIFGRTLGQVNPLKIYKEFQNERKKHFKQIYKEQEVSNPYAATPQRIRVKTTVPDDEAAKKAVLRKYSRYGVTDILSKEQYDLLSGMGYSSSGNGVPTRYSDITKGFNNLVTARSRYTTNMASYDVPDERIKSTITTSNRSDLVMKIEKDGKQGNYITDYKKLNLKDSQNTKGNSVTNIEYDPDYKSMIVVTLSGGKDPGKYIMDPSVLGGDSFKNAIRQMEEMGATPERIAQEMKFMLNSYNKTKSKTDKED